MNNKERIIQIEEILHYGKMNSQDCSIADDFIEHGPWLVDRVKRLTEALQRISAQNKSAGSFSGDLEQNYWRHQELLSREIASKALEGDV